MRVNYVLFGSLTAILIIISLILIGIKINYSKCVSILNNEPNDDILIETNSGTVKGYLNQWNDFKVYQFLGIPYAEPPVHENRFRIAGPRNWTGVYEANRWPAFCKQINLEQYEYLTPINNYNTSEDCLYLNIWTPIDITSIKSNERTGSLKPVIVYIHGGVFVYMGTSFDIFDGTVVSSLGDVVFVTVNYRLGVFGFLDTGDYQTDQTNEEFDTNVGLYDQITALNWIKDNIKQFGGNPDQITLMGQSAGAIAIGLLMSTPLASDLFQRVILESASPMQMKFFFEISAKNYKRVLQLTNCSSDTVQCLRQLNENQLNCVHNVLMNNSFLSFAPTIPSLMLGQLPRDAFDVNLADNDIQQKQILLGSNAEEGSLFLHQIRPEQFPLERLPELNRTGVYRLLKEFISGQQNLSESQIKSIFESTLGLSLETPELIRQQLSTVLGDFLFKCPVLKFANSLSEWPNVTVYMYYFTERSGLLPEWIGSSHFEEVQFVFGLPLRYPDKYSVKQQEFTQRLIKTWTQFARNGEMLPQLGKVWPKFTSESGQHMELNSDVSSIGVNLNENYYSIFETIFQTFN